ncbi:MAG: pyridoxal phosphate-dependent decarboxylase family protein, partial [Vitreimonas sp.]
MPHPFDVALKHAQAFRASLPDRPPRPTVSAGELALRLGGPTPEPGEDGAAVIAALAEAAEPGLMGVAGPRFFGWVIGASHEVGVAADWLTSAWGQNAGMYVGSPAAAVVEETAARWLVDILRLPPECSVGFVTGATMANFVGLAAARNAVLRRVGWDVEEQGLQGAPRVRVLIGEDAHTTVFAALRFLGLGAATAERIATDSQGRMDADALEHALAQTDGPCIVIAQAGQINTGAFDPIARIASACRARGAWLHIDGAFGLWARAVPELAHLAEGMEHADSWATDGHKWLQVPYDCGYVFVRDPEAHRRAMIIAASYLPQALTEYDAANFAPELSRRARGFATWAMIRHLGRAGIT